MSSSTHPTLLFVTDFSEASSKALRWAVDEAQRHHLHLSVLYPYRLDQVRKRENVVMSKKDLEREATELYENQVEGLLRNSKVSFDFHAEVGFVRDRVSEHARKSNVVMLVMGQRMATAESFTELMAEINVPMVILPSGHT